jgi:hypothetical protein
VTNIRTVIIILFSVLGVILIIFFVFDSDDTVRYQWHETYRVESDQPYGTAFIKKLLETYRPDGDFIFNRKKPLKDLLDSADLTETDYVFIGQNIHLNSQDEEALANFIYAGNDAFIASINAPESLLSRIHQFECDRSVFYMNNLAESANMNFYHQALKKTGGYDFAYRMGTEDRAYYWNIINREVFCDSARSIVAVGFLAPNEANFISIPHGKGNLYLHSNPIAFTNYFLTKPDKVDYASGVFSHMRGKNMIWDEFSKISFMRNNEEHYNSPLSYILQQPSLKYAWWMLLATIMLYVIFAAKRTQRVIPVLEQKTNTSLEFVQLISALHYQNGNHLDMARKKMKYFLYFIRSKYGIHAQSFKDEHMIKLAEKSKVSLGDVQGIFSQYSLIERNSYTNIEASRLLDLYFAIDNFYKHCK